VALAAMKVEVRSKKGSLIKQQTMVIDAARSDQTKSPSRYYRDISSLPLTISMPPHRTCTVHRPHRFV
jgi:hypothetical protein